MSRTRRHQFLDQAMPWLLGAGVFLASFLSPLETPWGLAGGVDPLWVGLGRVYWVVLLALASGITAAMVRWRLWPLCVVAVVAWLAYSMWPTVLVASYYAATRWEKRWQVALYLTLSTLLVVVPIFAAVPWLVNGVRFAVLMGAVMIVMPYTAGLFVRTRRRLIGELRARNETQAAQARAEERTRIAREMHDVVAHRVSLMVLHAGALEMGAKDQRTSREAALIRSAGREALNELRHVLGVLREPRKVPAPQPLPVSLHELVEETRRAGVEVGLTMEGEPARLPVAVERTVYRVVQEALTNAVKHAPGARAEVLLRHGSGFVAVTVQNGPPASLGAEQATASGAELLALQLKRRYGGDRPERLPSSGLGLIGLRERIDLLGGEFEAGPLEDGGFRVSAWLPSDGDVLQLPGEDVRRAV